MTMLQKERWIFDASRGLKRDTKNPQQSDQDLRSFSEPQNTVIEIEEDDIVVPAAKKKPRSRTKRHPVVPADEIDFSDAIGPAPAKKQRKGKISSKAFTSAEVFDDDFDMNSAKLSQGKRKENNTQPPISAIPPKGPPPITSDDINGMLDAKLEKMFAIIATNQSNMEKSFAKALEEQRREFKAAQVGLSAPSRHAGLNYSPSGGLNFSPSTSLAGIIMLTNFTSILYINMYSEQMGFNCGTSASVHGVYLVCI